MINEPAQKPRLSSLEVRKHLAGGWVIAAIAKRTYQIAGQRCFLSDEQLPLVEEPDMTEAGVLEHDSDRILQRGMVDVIIDGFARAPKPSAMFTMSVAIAGTRREIAVIGERELRLRHDGSVALSDPEPIVEVPLRWEHAYGGVDLSMLASVGDPITLIAAKMGEPIDPEQTMYAYPRNPHGRGYLIEASPEGVAATQLPNLEDPAHLLTNQNVVRFDPELWPQAPRPVATAWLPYVYFPRSAQTGLPIASYARDIIEPAAFPEVRHGLLRPEALVADATPDKRIDVACAQGAAPGMRWSEVNPDAAIEVRNVHPQQPVWKWRLPGERPRMVYRIPKQPAVELEPKIRCLVIQPDKNLVSVLWVGEQRLQDPISMEQLKLAEYGTKWPS